MAEGLTGEYQALLKAAQDSSRRRGMPFADLVALAMAIATDRRAEFDELYGEGFAAALLRYAPGLPLRGDAGDVVAVLREAQKDDDLSPSQALAARLPDLRELVTAASAPKQPSLNLVELVERSKARVAQGGADEAVPEEEVDVRELAAQLRERIKGQDEAIDVLTRRLAVKLAELDLKPERPNGVFMFVGPTGVGKTELALALSEELFDGDGGLIRLDMSEYSEPWAASRLIGPEQGYVGSRSPGGWLTTRVARNPRVVLLLDEIEKADPDIWNKFLQVFDSGRLTDSRGRTASFSDTVVIMTSNLGSSVFTEQPVGFSVGGEDDGEKVEREENALTEAVRKALPPELMNRLDAVVTFKALEPEEIREICDAEIDRLVQRLAGRDIELVVPEEVREMVATSGQDRRYGARHLQRNIERLLLEPLAISGPRTGRAVALLREGEVSFDQRPGGSDNR